MQLLECYFYFLIRISSPATFISELFLFFNFKLASCYEYSKGYFYFLYSHVSGAMLISAAHVVDTYYYFIYLSTVIRVNDRMFKKSKFASAA